MELARKQWLVRRPCLGFANLDEQQSLNELWPQQARKKLKPWRARARERQRLTLDSSVENWQVTYTNPAHAILYCSSCVDKQATYHTQCIIQAVMCCICPNYA
jgi:hypothetical protein